MPSLALNKILLASANANSTAAYFIAGSTGLTSGASSVLAAGSYIFYPVANVAVQVNNWSGSGLAGWEDEAQGGSANGGGLVENAAEEDGE